MEENKDLILNESNNQVQGLEGFKTNTNSKTKINVITTITDEKQLFNLENKVDYKLNDCVGEKIRVKDMLCKIIEKPLDEPIYNEETGEILKDKEFQMITILVDDEGKSYVTASKTFFFAFKKLCQYYTEETIKEGIDIMIIKTNVKDSNNKALNFELV